MCHGTASYSLVAVQELRSELDKLGLDSTGLKQALVDRLEAALAAPAPAPTSESAPDTAKPGPAATTAAPQAWGLLCTPTIT